MTAKLLRDDLVGSEEAAARFQREVRATAAFAHPNVGTLHDFAATADTRAFLVMELLAGMIAAPPHLGTHRNPHRSH